MKTLLLAKIRDNIDPFTGMDGDNVSFLMRRFSGARILRIHIRSMDHEFLFNKSLVDSLPEHGRPYLL